MSITRFGIIGCGLMGKEFAGAAGRWSHFNDSIPQPEIIAVCDPNPDAAQWFKARLPGVKYVFTDYKDLLALDEIQAVYCAVPHNLHKRIYCDIINAGKHLMGEKPFGIDKAANAAILDACKAHPGLIVRCASEFPYYPACQRLISWLNEGKTGRIIEARAGLRHSSDLDPNKPINWKRMIAVNGEYGCMGDLGIHTEHIPIRMGWEPLSVFADLRNIITQRPDREGNIVPCETWDNAELVCNMRNRDYEFPLTLEMKRIMPGATNDWYIEVQGLEKSLRFSTNDPNAFYYTQKEGREQAWCRIVVGNKPLLPTATADIFEFGFSDAILQMWGSYMCELNGIETQFECFKPEETAISHQLHTAALQSQATGKAICF